MNVITLPLRVSTTAEYLTLLEFSKQCHVPYSSVSKAVREGDLSQYLVDDKVHLNVAEALTYFSKKRLRIPIAAPDALGKADLFA